MTGGGDDLDHPPARPKRVDRYGPGLVVAALAAGFLINLGLRTRPDSLATALAASLLAWLLASGSRWRRPTIATPLVLVVAAAAIAAMRASPWVSGPALAVVAAGLVVAAGDRLLAHSGWPVTVLGYGADVVESLRVVGRSLGRITTVASGRDRAVRGVVLAFVVVAPLAWLLASADAVFGQLLSRLVDGDVWSHVVLTALVLPAIAGLIIGSRRAGAIARPVRPQARPATMVEGTIVLSAVACLLGAWGATQVLVALGGADRLLATADLTAAENARRGFFQLVAVTALLLVIVVGVDRLCGRATTGERRRFAALTGLIGLQTVGLVIAAYSRLALYVGGFGNTMLRTAVAWFLAWLLVVMILVVGVTNRAPGRPRPPLGGVLFVLAGLWVIGFGLSDPEAFVARGNLDRAAGTAAPVALDDNYLTSGLGADAVPILVDRLPSLPMATRARLTAELCYRPIVDQGWGPLDWNRGEARAAAAIASLRC